MAGLTGRLPFSVMKKWLRRLAYLLVIIIWLLVMAFPIFAFVLAGRGQIMLGEQTGSHVRIFLLREPDVEGVGVEWARPYRQQADCTRTSVTYILWEGESENTAYCQCFASQQGTAVPASCNPP